MSERGALGIRARVEADPGRARLREITARLEAGEAPEACAGRELIEETGYEGATITPLGRFYTSPGLSDELMWAYVATGLKHVGQRLELDERLTVHLVGVGEALAMVDSGELMDAKSMLTLLLGVRRGLIRA